MWCSQVFASCTEELKSPRKSPTFPQKSSTFRQKSLLYVHLGVVLLELIQLGVSMLHQKALNFCERAVYTRKRALYTHTWWQCCWSWCNWVLACCARLLPIDAAKLLPVHVFTWLCVIMYIYTYMCLHTYMYVYKHVLCSTGWRRPIGCLKLQVVFAKEPLIIGLFCGKWPIKIRHPMTLRHFVQCVTLGSRWQKSH